MQKEKEETAKRKKETLERRRLRQSKRAEPADPSDVGDFYKTQFKERVTLLKNRQGRSVKERGAEIDEEIVEYGQKGWEEKEKVGEDWIKKHVTPSRLPEPHVVLPSGRVAKKSREETEIARDIERGVEDMAKHGVGASIVDVQAQTRAKAEAERVQQVNVQVDKSLVRALEAEMDIQESELVAENKEKALLIDDAVESVRAAAEATRNVEDIRATLSKEDKDYIDAKKRLKIVAADRERYLREQNALMAATLLTPSEIAAARAPYAPRVPRPRKDDDPAFVRRVMAKHHETASKLKPLSSRVTELAGAEASADARQRDVSRAKRKAEEKKGTVEAMGARVSTKRAKLVETQEQAARTKARYDRSKFLNMNPLDPAGLTLPPSLKDDMEATKRRDARANIVQTAKTGPQGSQYDSTNVEFDKWLKSTTTQKELKAAIARLHPLLREEPKTIEGKKRISSIKRRLGRIDKRKSGIKDGDILVSTTTGLGKRPKRKASPKPGRKPKLRKAAGGTKVAAGFFTKVKKQRKPRKKAPKQVKKPVANNISRYFF